MSLLDRIEKSRMDKLVRSTNKLVVAVQPTIEKTGDYELCRTVVSLINNGVLVTISDVEEYVGFNIE